MPPGTKLTLTVIRDGKEKDFTFELATRPGKEAEKQTPAEESTVEKLGLTVQNLTPDLAKQFGYKNETGIIVTAVEQGSPAEEKQLVPGTLILEVNRQKVKDVDEFWKAVKKAGNSILFYILQEDISRYVVVNLNE
ncbi:MAG TPA: hypothetical protein DCP47_03895 [Phycisphaerales bacterium]|nr:hypothetical protein [Phycisphaerales bacterium]